MGEETEAGIGKSGLGAPTAYVMARPPESGIPCTIYEVP
jgi:hypothetical protein